MKKIFQKYFLILGAVIFVSSCTKDKNLYQVNQATAPSSSISLTSTTTSVLNMSLATQNNNAIIFSWNSVWYGTSTPVTYTLQYDSVGKNFANPNTYSAGSSVYSLDVTQLQLNNFGKQCGIPVDSTGTVEFRIVSSIGTEGSLPVYSNTINVTFSIFDVVVFWGLPGKYQGWDNTKALLGSTDMTNYEGYVYVPAGTSNVPLNDGFKIVPVLGSWNVAYGDGGGDYWNPLSGSAVAGTGGGNLSSSGTNIVWPNIGNNFTTSMFYLVQATTDKWSARALTSLSVIGDFNNWKGDVPMTYNANTGLWTATVNFTGTGGFKIRENNDWTFSYGLISSTTNSVATSVPSGYPSGTSITNIPAPSAGSHVVTLDLTHPMRYTYSVQ